VYYLGQQVYTGFSFGDFDNSTYEQNITGAVYHQAYRYCS